MNSGLATLLSLPAYTTITSQCFSKDGQFLVTANDQGRIAIFKVTDIIDQTESNQVFFQFEAGSALEESSRSTNKKNGGGGCINSLISTKDFLIAALSRPTVNADPAIVAFSWKDLSQQRSKLSWSIDSSSGLLPKDINSIDLDENEEKMFVVGGLGAAQDPIKDFAVRILDLETRMEATKPMLGHTGYIHSVKYSPVNQLVATASEDGSIRTWDSRSPKPCSTILEPWKDSNLSRPKLGKWLGDVSINGEWIVTGGGPLAALWHLRAMAPTVVPNLPPDTCGAVHVTAMIKSDDRIVIGGQFQGGLMYHFNMQGSLMAEVKTRASCLYSVVANEETDHKLMSAAGASSQITLCTHNFSYSDNSVTFPTL